MKNFALIGAGGFIAPRHMKAIKETGNSLVAAFDRNDSVGIIDSYFPNAEFFVEFERFDWYMYKKIKEGVNVDYVSICSPNYLHESHIQFSLRSGADAICEKPLVLNPSDIDPLLAVENSSGRKVWNIFQLRLHPAIISLREKIQNELKLNPNKKFDIDLTYLTSRGNWYFTSWKGDVKKSGGIATNIGVLFYDMITWIFGAVKQNIVHLHHDDAASGFLELEHARVRWFLSVNYEYIPEQAKSQDKRTYRSITVNGEEIEFSEGFTDLHTKSYQEILNGNGFGLNEARNSIQIVSEIRNLTPIGLKGDYHPFAKKVIV